jgi:beta-galactosidase
MILGADYYPEHWSRERWEIDAKLMKEAGIKFVRLAEFAWHKMEPEEGKYDFDWLDEAIEVLTKEGIKVILGTPTAVPPMWLVKKYPEILPVDSDGHVMGPGGRRFYCYNSPKYHEFTEKIVSTMAKHYKDNPNVIGWQIDNEFGCHESNYCYCDNCLRAFQEWVRQKYVTIDNLNEKWGTVFWSGSFNSWSEVILPRKTVAIHNPSLLLDYRRFVSDSIVRYQRLQIDILRKITPDKFITHNFMGLFDGVDYYKLSEDLDLVSWDNYPKTPWGYDFVATALAHDIMRGVKRKNFWVMEEQSGNVGWPIMAPAPLPGEIRLWTYQAIAHGADAISYFRWRTCNFGAEQYWHGILDYDGKPRRRYEEIQRTARELEKLKQSFEGSFVENNVAIAYSYDVIWAWKSQPCIPDFEYRDVLKKIYGVLFKNHVPVDIVNPEKKIPSSYELLIVPFLYIVNETIVENLKEYVKNGGKLVLTFRSGIKNWQNIMTTETLPGNLRELVGGYVYEYTVINDEVDIKSLINSSIWKAENFCERLIPESANVLAEYSSKLYSNSAAVLENDYFNGKVIYIGTDLEEKAIEELVFRLISKPEYIASPEVEISIRKKENKEFIFVLNHSQKYNDVMGINGKELITDEKVDGKISVGPFEVKIIERIKG